jgi:hypothetical protein
MKRIIKLQWTATNFIILFAENTVEHVMKLCTLDSYNILLLDEITGFDDTKKPLILKINCKRTKRQGT